LVKPLDDYMLEVGFDNGEYRIFDVKPYLAFPSFKGVAQCFHTVHIAGLSIEWNTGADICPDELYYDSEPIR